MNKRFFAVAFAIGLLTVAWVGLGFVGSASWLALAMTLAIGGVYLLGALELRQFRATTGALEAALAPAPQPPASLGEWLERLPPSLRQAVRLRVEGERGGLPGPALTPYLVGLLVMLGMLGTFLGMVVTFKGAVFALERSSDLQAMRAALAEPIKGLGLSFGTSIAGVAASAMLGLMSAMARRERMEVARQLESRIATELRPFSLAHQRQETFGALQLQARALPEVALKLDALMQRLDQRSQELDEQLLGRQAQFHREATQAYTELARSVGASLQDSLGASAKAAGETIRPVVESAMAQIATQTERLHERLGDVAQQQVDALTQQFSSTARGVSEQWSSALQEHARTSQAVTGGLQQALDGFTQRFEQRSAALLASVQESLARSQSEQARGEQERLQAWTQSLQAMASGLQDQWQRVGSEALEQQQAVCQALQATAQEVAERASTQANRTLEDSSRLLAKSEELVRSRAETEAQWIEQHGRRMDDMAGAIAAQAGAQAQRALEDSARLLAQSEELVRARTESETRWLEQHGQRMDQLAELWRTGLAALRQEERERGEGAVQRLGELQAAVSQHLASLGASLEAPMTRLMQTASEVPQAAAGVITQLREEMGRMTERDNLALQERTALVEQLGTLLQTVNQASGEQRAAIEALVGSASSVLDQARSQFATALDEQSGKAADMAAHVSGSALELASLAEAFGHSVQMFQSTNDKLVETLQRIEASINRSTARSDEQLAYYVAQAREVIDLSIASQHGLVENLRKLQPRPIAVAEEARA